jgi:polysaccharide pyruvyl transferase WcaK-like protein
MLPWHGTAGMFGIPTLSSIRRSDVTIIYDAMLFDRNLWNPLTNYMSTAWAFLKHLKRSGSVVGFYNVGAGPVTTDWGKRMLRELGELADFITVREEDSYNLLKDFGINEEKMLITADNAIPVSCPSEQKIDQIFKSIKLDPNNEILAININSYLNSWAGLDQKTLTKDDFINTYSQALNQFLNEKKVPVLFVATQHSDVPVTKELMEKTTGAYGKALFSNIEYNHHDVKGVLSKVSLLFGMRLHANILATSALTPAVALVFQKKVESYYNVLGLPKNILSFSDFSKESLLSQLNYGWDTRKEVREKLTAIIPKLALETAKAAEIISAIDQGKDYLKVLTELKKSVN